MFVAERSADGCVLSSGVSSGIMKLFSFFHDSSFDLAIGRAAGSSLVIPETAGIAGCLIERYAYYRIEASEDNDRKRIT